MRRSNPIPEGAKIIPPEVQFGNELEKGQHRRLLRTNKDAPIDSYFLATGLTQTFAEGEARFVVDISMGTGFWTNSADVWGI